jgi:hypothetical protein
MTPEYTKDPTIMKSAADQIRHCTEGRGPHDPRGNPVSKNTNWAIAHWDGIPYNGPLGKEGKDVMYNFLVPDKANPYAIKGLEEFFYSRKPFQDNNNPTVAEIDTWNLEVVRHIRSVFGIVNSVGPTTGPYYGKIIPVAPDPRLYLETAWAQERKQSQVWDTDYPTGVIKNGIETFGKAPGPCWLPLPPPLPHPNADRPIGYDPHCGATFGISNTAQRIKYHEGAPYYLNRAAFGNTDDEKRAFYNALPLDDPYKNIYIHSGTGISNAEGVSGTGKDVPWSHKLAFIIANYIKGEGNTGHAGPFFTRPYVGFCFTCNDDGVSFRGKYAGRIRADNGKLDVPWIGYTPTP